MCNVAIPRDILGMERKIFALDWGMFCLNNFLVTFDETKCRKCIIVQATHCGSISREPLNNFWEHSNTVFQISNVFCSSQYHISYVLKIYKGVLLILLCHELLLKIHILCALSRQNCLTRKILRKKYLNREQNLCDPYLKSHVVWPHCVVECLTC